MLEIRRVVDPGGENGDDGGSIGDRWGRRLERHAEIVRIVPNRTDATPGEQLREHLHHRLAVLEHVGDAGWGSTVVL